MIDINALLVFLVKKFGPFEISMQEWRANETLHDDVYLKITPSEDMSTMTLEVKEEIDDA